MDVSVEGKAMRGESRAFVEAFGQQACAALNDTDWVKASR